MAAHKHGPGAPDFRERAKKLVESWRQKAQRLEQSATNVTGMTFVAAIRVLADELEEALKP